MPISRFDVIVYGGTPGGAADGCLSEVSFASAIQAGTRALEQIRRSAVRQAA